MNVLVRRTSLAGEQGKSGEGEGRFVAKLSDMEFAKDINISSSGGHGAEASTRAGGTTDWQAPEVHMGKPNTKGSDVFSLGLVIFFVVCDGEHVLGNGPARTSNLSKIAFSRSTDHLAANLRIAEPEVAGLVGPMLGHDPAKRPSAAEALAHPFFWSLEEKAAFIGRIKRALDSEEAAKGGRPLMEAVNAVGATGMDEDWRRCPGLTAAFWGSGTPGTFVKGDGSVNRFGGRWSDLVRFIRNLSQHFAHQRPAVRAELSAGAGVGVGAGAGAGRGNEAGDEVLEAVREQERAVAAFFVARFPALVPRLWKAQKAVRAGGGAGLAAAAAAAARAAASAGGAAWACPRCTLRNSASEVVCAACEQPRPAGDAAGF